VYVPSLTRQVIPKRGIYIIKTFITPCFVLTSGCLIIMAFSDRSDLHGWWKLNIHFQLFIFV